MAKHPESTQKLFQWMGTEARIAEFLGFLPNMSLPEETKAIVQLALAEFVSLRRQAMMAGVVQGYEPLMDFGPSPPAPPKPEYKPRKPKKKK